MDVRLHEGLLCAKVGGRIPKVCLLCGATKDVVRRHQEYAVGASYGAGAGAGGGVVGAMVAQSLRGMDRGLAAAVIVGIVVVVAVGATLAHRATPTIPMELPLCQTCDGRWADAMQHRIWLLLALALFFALVVIGIALDAMMILGASMLVLVASLAAAWALGLRNRVLHVGWVKAHEIAFRVSPEIATKVLERAERKTRKGAGAAAGSDTVSGSDTVPAAVTGSERDDA